MARILAIDYGLKRVGVATTDPLQIIATALQTVESHQIIVFLEKYMAHEPVEKIIVGMPSRLNGADSHITQKVVKFIEQLRQKFKGIEVLPHDERFTSKMALQSMIMAGVGKKERSHKPNVDMVSATIILQSYLEQQEISKQV